MPPAIVLPHSPHSVKGHFSYGHRINGRAVAAIRLQAHLGRVDWHPPYVDPGFDGLSGLYCDDQAHTKHWARTRRPFDPALVSFAYTHLLPVGDAFLELAPQLVRAVLESPAAAGRWNRLTVSWRFMLDVSSGGSSVRSSRFLVRQTHEPGMVFLHAGRHYGGVDKVFERASAFGADGDTSRHVGRDTPEWQALRRELAAGFGPATLALMASLRTGRGTG